MSAIWGMVSLSRNTVVKQCFEKMKTCYEKKCIIEKYGSYVSDYVCMGCGIQYVTEHAVYDEMPVEDDGSRFVFVADCMLDNREEVIRFLLRQGVHDRNWSTCGDGEIIYLAYRCMGRKCVDYLRGLYAFAVWENERRCLMLFTDHIAGRCLYFAKKGDILVFSTLVEPIKKAFSGISINIDYNIDYFKDFLLADKSLTMIVPGETPFIGINQVKPATVLEITETHIKEKQYWNISDSKWNGILLNADEWGKCFKEVYKACVKDAVRTHRQVGIAMSSGLDSTSVGVLAADMLKQQKKKLYSYTFVPELPPVKSVSEGYIYDESVIVGNLAKNYANMETVFMEQPGKNLFDNRDLCMELLEMPYKSVNYPDYLALFREGQKNDCAVYLTGAFGNTTVSFGNINHILYDWYQQRNQEKFLSCLGMYANRINMDAVELLPGILSNFNDFEKNRHKIWDEYIPGNPFLEKTIFVNYSLKERFGKDPRWTLMKGHIGHEDYSDFLYAITLMMQLGAVETKLGLYAGAVMRDPTRDKRMIEFCGAISYPLFANEGCPRWLICGNFREELTDEIITNWNRKGLLNGDYIQRVIRDWAKVQGRLFRIPQHKMLMPWIHKREIEDYIRNFDGASAEDRNRFDYLLALDGIVSFCQ